MFGLGCRASGLHLFVCKQHAEVITMVVHVGGSVSIEAGGGELQWWFDELKNDKCDLSR